MAVVYIDVENGAGQRQGNGPIISNSGWRTTLRMDRAGSFAFEMPATDPKAILIQKKRIVRAYCLMNGQRVEVGAGIIDNIEKIPQADGKVILRASGDDLVRELTYRSVLDLRLYIGGNPVSHAAALTAVNSFAPAGWVFTPDGAPPNDSIYGYFNGETVLQGAIKIAEKSQNHFYRGVGRSLIYTSSFASSGVRAIRARGNLAANTCAITSLTEHVDTYDLITRIYPRGSGVGPNTQLTLRAATVVMPAGFTMSTAGNYIENDAAVATYGIIERQIDFEEIGPIDNTDADIQAASNMLALAALETLKRQSTELEQATYTVQVTGCSQLLRPMQSIRVVERNLAAGLNINADLNILEATWQIDESGIHTTDLKVSNADRWPRSDVGTLVDGIEKGHVYRALQQLGPGTPIYCFSKNVDSDETAGFRFRFGREVTQLQQVLFEFQLLPFESTVKSISGETGTSSSGGGSVESASSGGSHTHDVTVPAHSHTVTIASHMHSVTVTNHSHTVTVASHTHAVTVAAHSHTVTIAAHTHAVTVAAHSHTVTIVAHSHTTTVAGHSHTVTIPAHSHTVTVSSHSHGVFISSHSHTVTIVSHSHTTTVAGHSHTTTIAGHSHTVTISGHNHTVAIAGHSHTVTVAGHNHTVTIPSHDHEIEVFDTPSPGSPSMKTLFLDISNEIFAVGVSGTGNVEYLPTTDNKAQETVSSNTTSQTTPTSNTTSDVTPTSNTTAQITPTSNTTAQITPTSSTLADTSPTSSTLAQSTPTSATAGAGIFSSDGGGGQTVTSSDLAEATPTSSTLAQTTPTSSTLAQTTPTSNDSGGQTVTSSTLSQTTPTSNDSGGQTVTSSTLAATTPTSSDGGGQTVTSSTLAQTTPSSNLQAQSVETSSSNGTHNHTVTVPAHTHTLTPVITTVYGIFRDTVGNTYEVEGLEYQVNGGGWNDLATDVDDAGDGWLQLDITSLVMDSVSFRPLQANNLLEIRAIAPSLDKRATIDAQLSVRNIIQAVAYV